MVNAAFFRKINLNYSRPRIIELAKQDLLNNIYKTDKITSSKKKLTKLKEYKLIIYYPTIPGFSFSDKL
jgi:hypothetical protein